MSLKRLLCASAAAVLFCTILTGCSAPTAGTPLAAESSGLRKVSVRLAWMPSPESAYLYVAKQRGYFKAEGLDVEIKTPSQQADVIKIVDSGTDQFGLTYPEDVIMARSKGAKLKAIGTTAQRNECGYISINPDITKPADFKGRVVGVLSTPSMMNRMDTMMKTAGVDRKSFREFDTGFGNYTMLASGKVDVAMSLATKGIPVMEGKGKKVTSFMHFYDFGAPEGYGHTLITSDKILSEDPELVRAFTRAMYKGVQYVVDNPVEAGQVFSEVVPEGDELKVCTETNKRLVEVLESEDTKAHQLGWMSEKKMQEMHDWMLNYKMIDKPVAIKDAYTMDYLP